MGSVGPDVCVICNIDSSTSGPELQYWICVSCSGDTFCDVCWERERIHKPGKVGQDGLPHEKTSREIHARLKAVFEQTEERSKLLQLHIDDEETLWFAIEKDDADNKCRFTDRGRFTNLMMMTKQPSPGTRYPLLVSFVGQTGQLFLLNPIFELTWIRCRQKHSHQDAGVTQGSKPESHCNSG